MKLSRLVIGCMCALALSAATFTRTGSEATLAAPASKVDKTTLVVALFASPAELDPASAYDGTSVNVLRNVSDALVLLRGNSTTMYEPRLAEGWSVSKDGRIWTFNIRRGVTCQDGTSLTATVVRDSIARIINLKLATSFIYTQFMDAKGLEVLGPYTLRFRLKNPSPVFIKAISSDYGSWIIPTGVVKAHDKKDGAHEWLKDHSVGCGPYRLTQFKRNQQVVLEKFPAFWKSWTGKHVDKVVILTVPETATRREMIERGDADIVAGLPVEDIEVLKKNPGLVVDETYGTRLLEIIFTVKGPLKDARVRKAFSYAFDYDGFAKELLKGHARRARGPVSSVIEGHDRSLFLYPTDLEKARKLLGEANVAPGTAFTLWYQTGDAPSRDVAQVMQVQLEKLGLKLKLVEKPVDSFFSTFYGPDPPDKRPDLFVYYWWPDYNDVGDSLYVQFHSSTAGNGGNGGFFKNRRVDELLDASNGTLDPSKRREIQTELQRLLTVDDPGGIYIAELPESVVYRKNVKGVVVNPIYIGTFDFFAMWKE